MKKITSVLLCMVLLLSMFSVNAAAAQTACMEAGVMVSDAGIVTVTVSAKQSAANAHLTVDFDSDYLLYDTCETAFEVHSVEEEDGKITIGLASASANAVKEGDVVARISFLMTGHWDKTDITVTAESFGGKAVNESVVLTAVGGGYRFVDVKADDWFYGAVDYMTSEGYIVGISENQFGPELNMRRADFVTLLGRLEGVEKTFAETCFVDVPAESYYSGYVAWAAEKGITIGVDATHFNPKASIDRAQMVTFLYRYALSEGMDVTVADPDAVLAQFSDVDSLPGWSVAPFAWAVEQGIIVGMDGKLAPKGTATRAQAAAVLYRYFFEA